jgi:hypothetical protein
MITNNVPVEIALRKLELLEGFPPNTLWIAPDVRGNEAIWRMRGPDDLLHCVGHVQAERFSQLLAEAVIEQLRNRHD